MKYGNDDSILGITELDGLEEKIFLCWKNYHSGASAVGGKYRAGGMQIGKILVGQARPCGVSNSQAILVSLQSYSTISRRHFSVVKVFLTTEVTREGAPTCGHALFWFRFTHVDKVELSAIRNFRIVQSWLFGSEVFDTAIA